ncbi:T9SS C-terminal target domain-containing protein [Flavobacterium sp.]|uniref:T9SS C-terminal target domain-containing protein n=1 Tax=Flavobacterium sp. TaxID=239 RepID=UPI002B6EAAAA|nr:T9SS C-terminal target domain-containing protein [Flavobacterium sp.]HSD08411.1 hypothetical protein [Flavobacterium sp.]
MFKYLILSFLFITTSYSQISGCTDIFASNFDPNATENNGSCWYRNTKVRAKSSTKIDASLSETSGLIDFEGLIWTFNDDHDNTIYGLDTKGEIKRKINLEGIKNNNWEEISQDSLYLYIGDFGNNIQGNRRDLEILKIEKKSFLTGTPQIETIAFSYSNQTDFSGKEVNTTDFDCEAFIVLKDSIYLITKQWTAEKTSIYSLPKNPGKYIAHLRETLDVHGLITGATTIPSKKEVVLCGYTKLLQPFLLLLYDYQNEAFWTGNRRKIKVSLPWEQIEGITTEDGSLFYLSNESIIRKPFINSPQRLHIIDLSPFFKK